MIAMFTGRLSNSNADQKNLPSGTEFTNRKQQGIALLAHGQ
jgi:hypothetical protein